MPEIGLQLRHQVTETGDAPRPIHPREVHQRALGRQETGPERYPKDRYQTEVESWRILQSANIEFTMKRLREPIDG
jgi:hypothetical protein